MDDDIQLPPIPNTAFSDWIDSIRRAAVLADRERRALWEAQPAKPKVHSARMVLTSSGYAWMECGGKPLRPEHTVILCWTDDGKAWVDSEANRVNAAFLRVQSTVSSNQGLCKEDLLHVANALDGGER